jgi:hypothetical protein
MLDKSIKVNLILPRSLWKALALASASVGKSRAEFARTTLTVACAGQSAKGYPISPAPSQPTRQPVEAVRWPSPQSESEQPLRVQPYNPQQNYCETRALGVNHEHALQSVLEECHQRGIEWECTQEIRRLGDGWI